MLPEEMLNQVTGQLRAVSSLVSTKDGAHFYFADARNALCHLPDASINCVITSPPYASLKDYGGESQLGFGQNLVDEYLPELGRVLEQLYRIVVSGGALWLVVDTFRLDGELIPLPWQVIELAKQAGWKPLDVIVWDKGKSLPWSSTGRFRGVFEYVLLFSKGDLTKFDVNAVRETDGLSPYWVRYPERYHPMGKAPSDIWHFPIPVQGSWCEDQVRHACPFPLDLVARMILLTTGPDDMVLDPFAGSGSVLAAASHLGRHSIGIDSNREHIKTFDITGFDHLISEASRVGLSVHTSGTMKDTIVLLRMLKYACTLYTQISRPDQLGEGASSVIAAFIVKDLEIHTQEKADGFRGSCKLYIIYQGPGLGSDILTRINAVIKRPPLSKFQIACDIDLVDHSDRDAVEMALGGGGGRWYVYERLRFHDYKAEWSKDQTLDWVSDVALTDAKRKPLVISDIGLRIDKPENGG